MSIAIIDSGINLNYNIFKNKNIIGINLDNYSEKIDDLIDYSGHGTSCASEILRLNPKEELKIIKILNENSQSSIKKLIEAIEYSSELPDVKIISISASTTKYNELNDLKKIVDYTTKKKNKLIISASDNRNIVSYPSYLKNVIGVQRSISDINTYWFNKKYDIQCICKGRFRLLPSKNKNYCFFGGNSYCTAYFSGIISKMNLPELDMNKKLDIIEKNADRTIWTKNNISITKDFYYKELDTYTFEDYEKIENLKKIILKFNRNIIFNNSQKLYEQIGLINVFYFINYLNKELKINLNYTDITSDNLISIVSLNNFINNYLKENYL